MHNQENEGKTFHVDYILQLFGGELSCIDPMKTSKRGR